MWIDETLFSVGDFDVTAKHAIISSGAILVIALVIFAICSYIAYRKREVIAVEARRLSVAARSSFRRMSTSVKRRFSTAGGAEPKDEEN